MQISQGKEQKPDRNNKLINNLRLMLGLLVCFKHWFSQIFMVNNTLYASCLQFYFCHYHSVTITLSEEKDLIPILTSSILNGKKA